MRKSFLLAIFLGIFGMAYGEESTMPVLEIPFTEQPIRKGWEERTYEYRQWLSPSVRILSSGKSGSGTMCYYDEKSNEMYIVSCGHLFDRGRSRGKGEVTIDVFYQNNVKLDKEKTYKAKVIAHVWENNYDVSLMKFAPDWKNPWYLPIHPYKPALTEGGWYHSCGSDGRTEVAHYLVQYQSERPIMSRSDLTELVSMYNAPRGGRSGGGLFSEDGYLIGICSRAGGNTGLWTSINQIHQFIAEENMAYIVSNASLSKVYKMTIVNKTRSSGPFTVPLPSMNRTYGVLAP